MRTLRSAAPLAKTAAQELLLALACGESLPGEADPRWSEALLLAERHGIAPLLHEQLQKQSIPGSVRAQLRVARIAELAREERREKSLVRALHALEREAGGPLIPVLLLKGASSARTLYASGELRPRVDLDLLVLPVQRQLAVERLQALGYVQHAATRGTGEDDADWHELTLVDPVDPAQHLDLHFALSQPERHGLCGERLVAAGMPAPALGAAARILPAEEAALVCAYSIALHELTSPLVVLCDLARLLARCDLHRLVAFAREVRLVRSLHVSVSLLAQLGRRAGNEGRESGLPRATFLLCGAPVSPSQLEQLLDLLGLASVTRLILDAAAAGYDLSRAPPSRAQQLIRKTLFIDRPVDALRFATRHLKRRLRRMASQR